MIPNLQADIEMSREGREGIVSLRQLRGLRATPFVSS
jgi:hypothetical protein